MLLAFVNQPGPRDKLLGFFQQVIQYIGDVVVWMGPVQAAMVGGFALGLLVGLPIAYAWAFDISRTVWVLIGTATLSAYTPRECLPPAIGLLILWLVVSIFIMNNAAWLSFGLAMFFAYVMVWGGAIIVKGTREGGYPDLG
ncbi:MAG: hypothetical protein HY711_07085 [Candidatus Melainabacteria bacterium]|nr:hypothetical protein [Candidatus Melainabacteria bacterium]